MATTNENTPPIGVIEQLVNEAARVQDMQQLQNQLIYELCRAFVSVGNADPTSLIQVIKAACNTNTMHPDCDTMVTTLIAALEHEFITDNNPEQRPKLRLVSDADE